MHQPIESTRTQLSIPEGVKQPSASTETVMQTPSLVLLTGSSNQGLAESIRRNLQQIIGEEIIVFETPTIQFPDTETGTSIKSNLRGKDVYIVQPTSPVFGENGEIKLSVNDSLQELEQMAWAAKISGAKSLTAIIPYYGYARSDRETAQRQPITATLVAQALEPFGINTILTSDLHAGQVRGFWRGGEWIDFSIATILASSLKEHIVDLENLVVVAPDYGAYERAQILATKLGIPLEQVGFFPKTRINPTTVSLGALQNANVQGKRAIIVDDIISTATTILEAAKKLVDEYGATGVDIAASHGLFVNDAIEKINSSAYIEKVYTSNSVHQRQRIIASSKINIIDTGALWARAIYNIHYGQSVRTLNT